MIINRLPGYRVLAMLSHGYFRLKGLYLHVTNPFAGCASALRPKYPHDLHALSTQPAFTLDQDQILKKNEFIAEQL